MMPLRLYVVITPPLLMPPEKGDSGKGAAAEPAPPTTTPLVNAETVPVLAMPPPKVAMAPMVRMPVAPEIVPALLMPPPKVGAEKKIAEPSAMSALCLSIEMPPLMTPVLEIEPVTVPLTSAMPDGLIVPSLVMLPVKLVFWTQTLAVVCAAGLSNAAEIVCTHDAAHAEGMPAPIRSAIAELDSNKARLRPRAYIDKNTPCPGVAARLRNKIKKSAASRLWHAARRVEIKQPFDSLNSCPMLPTGHTNLALAFLPTLSH